MGPVPLVRRLRWQFTLVALVPLIVVGGLALFWLLPQVRGEIADHHQEMAHSLAGQVADHLRGAERDLRSLAEYLVLQGGQPASQINQLLDAHAPGDKIFEAIYLTSADGGIFAVGLPQERAGRRQDLLGIDLSHRDFIATVRQTGKSVWSDTFLSTVGGQLAVAFATPVGQRVLVGEVTIGRLTDYLSSLPFQSRLAVAVLDGRGQVIAYNKRSLAGQQLDLSGQEPAGGALAAGMALQSLDIQGEKYLGSLVEVRQLGWRVLVAQLLNDALRPLRATLWSLGVGLSCALVLAMLAGWLLARGLSGEFRRLTNQARAMAEGQYAQPWPDSKIQEVAHLGTDLQKMAVAIRQRESALAGSESRLVKAQAVAHVGSYEIDLVSREVWGSAEAFRIYGLPITATETMDFALIQKITLAEDRPRLDQALQELLTKGTAYDQEFRIKRVRDGQVRHVRSKAELDLDEDGKPVKLLGTIQDITEQKLAEEALEANRRLLMESQAVARLGHYAIDLAGGTWESSAILDDILGIGGGHPRDLEGWLSLVHPQDRDEVAWFLRQHVAVTRGVFDREYRIIRADDRKERWVHGLGRLEADDQGQPIKMIGTIQDVTDRRQLEQQLLHAQKMEAVGQLAGGVAHDFNNMLSVILGYAELLQNEFSEGSPQWLKLSLINKAAKHSRDITRQLLAFSRKQIIAPTPLNLNELVNGTLKTLGRLIGENIQMTFHAADDLWLVKVDPAQVDQILVNMAVNARDAMSDGGKLLIETSNVVLDENYCRQHSETQPGNYVLLAVSDTGQGMGQETVARIFEPFFTTKAVGKGTGLGLATVYGIVKQNNGYINVYSEPGRGTTFKIYLPHAPGLDIPAPTTEPVKPETGSGTILLVEDDDLVRQVTASMLEELGYEVVSPKTASEAIDLCVGENHAFNLLITDVVMKDMSGKYLRDMIQALRPGLGVLFISGYTNDLIVNHGVLEEGVHFLAKPFNLTDLARKVREAMN